MKGKLSIAEVSLIIMVEMRPLNSGSRRNSRDWGDAIIEGGVISPDPWRWFAFWNMERLDL